MVIKLVDKKLLQIIYYIFNQVLLDCEWVRDLTVPMHLGLIWQALCAPYHCMGALLVC